MSTAEVSLREITAENVEAVLRLSVHEYQKRFVASNAVSIAQAHYSELAWFRAVYAGDSPVGFVMLSEDESKPEYFLWRFMIDIRHQGRGFGREALLQVIGRVREKPRADRLLTSVVPGRGSPQGFYEKLGFELTGEVDDGETLLSLSL